MTRPLKGIMLMGNGQDVLKNISMVGNDLLVIGGGTCGKDGQSKPVGLRQSHAEGGPYHHRRGKGVA